jgi:hypothetical protein
MAAEWLSVAKGITGIAEKIFGGLGKYGKLKAEERERLADLLDDIAKEVLSIAKQMNKKEIPSTPCERVLAYSIQLPPLVERVYDANIAEQLGSELAAVYQSRRLARSILQTSNPGRQQMAQIKALTSTIDASAGVIQATANILRAL